MMLSLKKREKKKVFFFFFVSDREKEREKILSSPLETNQLDFFSRIDRAREKKRKRTSVVHFCSLL